MPPKLPSPLELALRLALAGALTFTIVSLWGRVVVEALLPVLRAFIPLLDDQYSLLGLDIATVGPDTALRLRVNLAKPILIGTQMTLPAAEGWLQATTTVGTVVQAPALALTLLLAWPLAGLKEAAWRALGGILAVGALFLSDAPLVLWAYLWDMHVSAFDPERFSPLLVWQHFLQGGGRLALGTGLAVIVLAATRPRSKPVIPPVNTAAPVNPV